MLCSPSTFLRFGGAAAGIAAIVAACSTPDAVIAPSPHTGAGQYWSLILDHRAVTMSTVAPYDTIRLTATLRDATGNPITGVPMPMFTSSDLQRAQVDSNGVVHALAPGDGILVIASLSSASLTLDDTAIINVTDVASAPVLTVFTIHPDSGDSAETSVDQPRALPLRALDASGAPINALSVDYTASDLGVASVDRATGYVTGSYPGRVTIIASATAYGVTKADTLPYFIGYPVQGGFQAVPQIVGGRAALGFSPISLTLGVGALVGFQNYDTTTTIDVTFDNPAQVDSFPLFCSDFFRAAYPWLCASGNIAPFSRVPQVFFSWLRARTFPVPGTYTFHSAQYGTWGRIVIVDWRTL